MKLENINEIQPKNQPAGSEGQSGADGWTGGQTNQRTEFLRTLPLPKETKIEAKK